MPVDLCVDLILTFPIEIMLFSGFSYKDFSLLFLPYYVHPPHIIVFWIPTLWQNQIQRPGRSWVLFRGWSQEQTEGSGKVKHREGDNQRGGLRDDCSVAESWASTCWASLEDVQNIPLLSYLKSSEAEIFTLLFPSLVWRCFLRSHQLPSPSGCLGVRPQDARESL